MAISYVDYDLATGDNSGLTWPNAYHTTTPTQNGLTDAGAGGTVYIAAATATDLGTQLTLTSPGTIGNPTKIIGVDAGASSPPVNSEVLVRGTDTLPRFGSTGDGNVFLRGYAVVTGVRIESDDNFNGNGPQRWVYRDSELYAGTGASVRSWGAVDADEHWIAYNSEIRFNNTGSYIIVNLGGKVEWYGGVLAGSAILNLIDVTFEGQLTVRGVDLSAAASGLVIVDGGAGDTGIAELSNCKMPASFVLRDGQGNSPGYVIRATGCSSATGKTSGTSYRQSARATYEGLVLSETARVRTGGGNDGASGSIAYAMTPNALSTLESAMALRTDFIIGKIKGDGSTAKKFEMFIANDGLDIQNATYKWTVSGSGTNEYYLEIAAGGDPVLTGGEPENVSEDGGTNVMAAGTAGSLLAGEWDYADNDTLGFSTIYARLTSGGPDPDTDPTDMRAFYDVHQDQAWMEIFIPSEAGDATHEMDLGTWPANTIPGTTTIITDDTDSVWAAGARQEQKVSVTMTPDYTGPFYARMAYAQRFAANPVTLYVDGKVTVSDA